MFEKQIAPQIQQSYIASGLQRGTGLDDTLTRAGVDLDATINSAYMDYMQSTLDRGMKGLGMGLDADVGGQKLSSGDRWRQAIGGYMQSDAFGGLPSAMMKGMQGMSGGGMGGYGPQTYRPGYAGGY